MDEVVDEPITVSVLLFASRGDNKNTSRMKLFDAILGRSVY